MIVILQCTKGCMYVCACMCVCVCFGSRWPFITNHHLRFHCPIGFTFICKAAHSSSRANRWLGKKCMLRDTYGKTSWFLFFTQNQNQVLKAAKCADVMTCDDIWCPDICLMNWNRGCGALQSGDMVLFSVLQWSMFQNWANNTNTQLQDKLIRG